MHREELAAKFESSTWTIHLIHCQSTLDNRSHWCITRTPIFVLCKGKIRWMGFPCGQIKRNKEQRIVNKKAHVGLRRLFSTLNP
jgi:hypothetical protein